MKFTLFIVSIPLALQSLAAPLLHRAIADEPSLSVRQWLGALGGAARAGGSALSKVPERAGNKMAKEQGKNTGQTYGIDIEATAQSMLKNAEQRTGKKQSIECMRNTVEHGVKFGMQAGGSWNCDAPDPKKVEMEKARQKAFQAANGPVKDIWKSDAKAKAFQAAAAGRKL